jgi:hypothetical protein
MDELMTFQDAFPPLIDPKVQEFEGVVVLTGSAGGNPTYWLAEYGTDRYV